MASSQPYRPSLLLLPSQAGLTKLGFPYWKSNQFLRVSKNPSRQWQLSQKIGPNLIDKPKRRTISPAAQFHESSSGALMAFETIWQFGFWPD